jgi:hypothetical protein
VALARRKGRPEQSGLIGGIDVLFVVLGVGLGAYLWEENAKLTQLLEDEEISHAKQLAAA